MKLLPSAVVCASVLLAGGSLLAAAVPGSVPDATADDAAAEITRLADENFKVREEATGKLWAMGAAVSPQVREALKSADPEVAMRARYLMRRIDFDITPQTPPKVAELVDRFPQSAPDQRGEVIAELRKLRAYRQILKLYSFEKDAKVREKIHTIVSACAIQAAREEIVAGRPDEARKVLEMGPGDSQTLLALADFHRSHGTLKAELAKGAPPGSINPGAWRLALHRAAGDFKEARSEAESQGEKRIAATMAMMAGDPLPWLGINDTDGSSPLRSVYRELALKRLKGETLTARDLEMLEPMARNGDEGGRQLVYETLFLLGQTDPAEAMMRKQSPGIAFRHFDTLERPAEALAAVGIDPAKPDYRAWISKRFSTLAAEQDNNGDENDALNDLTAMAYFLEMRGLASELEAYDAPLLKLAESGPATFKSFKSFLGSLFIDPRTEEAGALGLARRVTAAYAGDDDTKWEEVLGEAFPTNTDLDKWWRWMADLDPKAGRPARFEGILALLQVSRDPAHSREHWLKLAWASVDAQDKDAAAEKVEMLANLGLAANDVATGLKARERTPVEVKDSEELRGYLMLLGAAGRWDRAAELWLKLVEQEPLAPNLHAYAATCLRRAGKTEEAAGEDALAEELALAEPNACVTIGQAYAWGGDEKRSAEWWDRAVVSAPPDWNIWQEVLAVSAQQSLENSDWPRAAACFEVLALIQTHYGVSEDTPTAKLRIRLNADFSRAMARLGTDRAGSLATLARCHHELVADGSLADDFFPALAKAGLKQQHDAWFEESWGVLQGVIKTYPDCANTLNTTAWMAARALLHLDEAEVLVDKALARMPGESNFLDTKGEIYFARKDRKRALELSRESLDSAPFKDALQKQYLRFQSAPFPGA